MENIKILTQELGLIEDLLQSVNTKEELDCLIDRAKQICPFWITPAKRDKFDLLEL